MRYFAIYFFSFGPLAAFLYGPRFMPVLKHTSFHDFGWPSISAFFRLAKRNLLRMCSKLRYPRAFLFISFGILFNDSMGPLDNRLSVTSSALYFLMTMKELMISSKCSWRDSAMSLKIRCLQFRYFLIISSNPFLALFGSPT